MKVAQPPPHEPHDHIVRRHAKRKIPRAYPIPRSSLPGNRDERLPNLQRTLQIDITRHTKHHCPMPGAHRIPQRPRPRILQARHLINLPTTPARRITPKSLSTRKRRKRIFLRRQRRGNSGRTRRRQRLRRSRQHRKRCHRKRKQGKLMMQTHEPPPTSIVNPSAQERMPTLSIAQSSNRTAKPNDIATPNPAPPATSPPSMTSTYPSARTSDTLHNPCKKSRKPLTPSALTTCITSAPIRAHNPGAALHNMEPSCAQTTEPPFPALLSQPQWKNPTFPLPF